MENKYFNDAVIGNKQVVASYRKTGELLRLCYPAPDTKQYLEYFHTGVKINDSGLIQLHEDSNNVYQQYYTEDTNILNTEIRNTYFNLKILQTDFVPIKENVVVKQYTFTNENTIPLEVHFLCHSQLLSDDNNAVSGKVNDYGMLQYSHDTVFGIVSSNTKIESHQINDTKSNIGSGMIQDKDYIGMSSDSSISYAIGTIAPNESKSICIFLCLHENKEKYKIEEAQAEFDKIRKMDVEKELANTKKYWNKYVKEHSRLVIKQTTESDKKISNIYRRTILLYPLLINDATGGISASIEVDEKKTTCGRYAYCWPRDAVFITKAFDLLGMEKETEKFYKGFCKNTQNKDGMWEQRFYTDERLAPCWGYQIDETASVVHGVYEHYQQTKNIKFLKENLKMLEKAVGFLQKYSTNLLEDKKQMPVSYDLWEMHEGVHTYSLASIFSAYESMLAIYQILEEDRTETTNRLKQENIMKQKEIMAKQLVDIKKYIIQELYDESKKSFVRGKQDDKMDISMLGLVVPFSVFSPKEKKMINTVERMDLTLRTYTGGYQRFEQDQYRNGNPWPIATLWRALYYIKVKEYKKAKECFNFVVSSATEHGFLAEQVDNKTLQPDWVIGLGWSHAMFILVLEQLMNK